MAFLEGFPDAEKTMLVRLPYRVGVWLSRSDKAGGDASDQRELQALDGAIAGLALGMFESAFVHEVISETFLRKQEWPVWAEHAESVPDECRAAIQSIRQRLPQRDADAFQRIIMMIAVDVARAHREDHADRTLVERLLGGAAWLWDQLIQAIQGQAIPRSNIVNISYKEDVALNALAQALRGE